MHLGSEKGLGKFCNSNIGGTDILLTGFKQSRVNNINSSLDLHHYQYNILFYMTFERPG